MPKASQIGRWCALMDLQLSEFRIELSYFLLELKGFLIPKMKEKKYFVSAAKVFAFWREKNGFMFRKVSFSIFNDFFTIVAVMEIEFRDCLETDRNDKSKYTWERDGNSVWKWFFFYFIDFHWRSASFGRQNKQKKRWSNEMFESNKKEKKKLKLTIERDVFASIVFVCAKQIVFDSIIDFQFTFFFRSETKAKILHNVRRWRHRQIDVKCFRSCNYCSIQIKILCRNDFDILAWSERLKTCNRRARALARSCEPCRHFILSRILMKLREILRKNSNNIVWTHRM